MPSIITENFKTLLAKQLLSLVDNSKNYQLTQNGGPLPESQKNFLYLVLGRQLSWQPTANTEGTSDPEETNEYFVQTYRNGIYAKKLSQENATLVVPRIDWVQNTVYNTYESNSDFYVLTSKDQIFKCLDNNSNTNSTIEPEISLTTTALDEPYFETSDGYKWKFLYSLHPSQKQKFLTDDWMPVYSNEFVKKQAISRSIDVVQITNSGSGYLDSPTSDIITVTGDGTDAILKANVSNGNVIGIVIQSRGQDYTYANAVFQSDVGSGATAIVKLSPEGGHGFDPISELKAKTFMVNIDFDGQEMNHPVNNEFRQAFLVYNPKIASNSAIADGNSYTLYTKIKVSTGSGDFNEDERILQGTDFTNPTYSADVIYFDSINNYVYVNNVKGTLEQNKQVYGNLTGTIRVAVDDEKPLLKIFSGDILYISNKPPVQRDIDQLDRVQFILSF